MQFCTFVTKVPIWSWLYEILPEPKTMMTFSCEGNNKQDEATRLTTHWPLYLILYPFILCVISMHLFYAFIRCQCFRALFYALFYAFILCIFLPPNILLLLYAFMLRHYSTTLFYALILCLNFTFFLLTPLCFALILPLFLRFYCMPLCYPLI